MQDDSSSVDLRGESAPVLNRRVFPLVLCVVIVIQAIGFGWLGVNRAGWLWSQSVQIVANLIAIACTIHAFRCARGFARQFWFLLTCSLVLWGIANGIFLHRTYAGLTNDSTTIFNFLYRGYGVPVLLILFIRGESESFDYDWLALLDSLQIGVVVIAVYIGYFSVFLQGRLLHDALSLNISNNLENVFLITATVVRLRFSRSRTLRSLLVRLLWFLLVYAAVSGVGNYISAYGDLAAWFDLFWTVPYCAAALLATRWTMHDEGMEGRIQNGRSLARILEANLSWAMLVLLVAVAGVHSPGKWQLLGTTTIAASILLYAARLSLTQHRQGRTIEVLNQTKRDFQQLSRHHSMILDSAGEGIVGIDAEGRQIFVNPAAAHMLGYRAEEMIGRSSHRMWHHSRADGNPFPVKECPIYAAFKDGIVHRGVDEVFWRKDGTSFWAEYVSTPIVENGRVTGSVVVFQEVTERRRAEDTLHLQAAALESAANTIVITNSDGNIEWANSAFTSLTGYRPDEVLGQNLLKSGTQAPEFYRDLWSTVRSGHVWHGELENRRKDGRLYTEEMTITPVRSKNGEIGHFIVIKQDVTQRKKSEKALKQAEEKYREIFENAVLGIFQCTPDGRFLTVNNEFAHMMGFESPEQMVVQITDMAHQLYTDPSRWREFQLLLSQEGLVRNFEYEAYRCDGGKSWLLANARTITGAKGEIAYYEGTTQDITENRLLEAQFRQAQKLEAVGRLAGGVAHDFNNMLGVIIGYGDILQTQVPPGDSAVASVTEIQRAAHRAANLTRQLLAFSRKQILQSQVLDLNKLIEELSKMLRHMIGEDVELVCRGGANLQRVKADPGQIEQVIMNLAVNAKDAMPNGGRLSIETANVEVDERFAERHPPMKPGLYVLLSVTDTGCGMNSETLARIFEPFFTTKELGKGTGLGLSIVYGVVKQSGGYIWVDSEPNCGTAFSLYLPVTTETFTTFAPPDSPVPVTGEETILVVEDEPSLRELVRTVLARSGYKVLEAHSGLEALSVLRATNGVVKLLLTDIVMPGEMNGPQLAETVSALRPDICTLFMTGFAEDLHNLEGLASRGVGVISKPFTSELLLRKVRERLDKGTAGQAAGDAPNKKGSKRGKPTL